VRAGAPGLLRAIDANDDTARAASIEGDAIDSRARDDPQVRRALARREVAIRGARTTAASLARQVDECALLVGAVVVEELR